jgi:hypothetical protein
MSTSAYVKLLDMQNKYVELLPVTAVFDHPKNSEGVEGYYSCGWKVSYNFQSA